MVDEVLWRVYGKVWLMDRGAFPTEAEAVAYSRVYDHRLTLDDVRTEESEFGWDVWSHRWNVLAEVKAAGVDDIDVSGFDVAEVRVVMKGSRAEHLLRVIGKVRMPQ